MIWDVTSVVCMKSKEMTVQYVCGRAEMDGVEC
jgi:hypothetical protein